MEIQQVGLDGKRIAAKGRTVPDVGDRVEAFVADAGASDIDAVSGHEFFIVRQIDRRDGIFRPIAASTAGAGENAERTPQQVACPAHAAFGKQLTDVAARNPLPAQAHLRIIVDLKSHLPAQLAQQLDVSRGFVPEVEVVAFVNLAGMQALLQNFMGKLVRRHQRKIAREGEQQNRVDAGGFQQAQFLRSRSQQFQVVIGTQDAGGVGLEGDSHRLRVSGFRSPHDLIQNMPVSAVYAVEVTDAEQRGTEVAGNIVEFVESSHPKAFYRRDAEQILLARCENETLFLKAKSPRLLSSRAKRGICSSAQDADPSLRSG